MHNLLIQFPNVPALLDAPKVARLVTLEIGKLNLGMFLNQNWFGVLSGDRH